MRTWMTDRVKVSALVTAITITSTFVWTACESESSPSLELSLDGGPTVNEPAAPDAFVLADAASPDAASSSSDAADDAAADAAPATTLPWATGLGASGTTLADGEVDPHWSVKDALDSALTPYVQTDALGYPGYWLAPSTTSKFISPFVDTVDPTGSGTFTYATTFYLAADVTLANASLTIRYASDNAMTAIQLNGASVGTVNAGSYSTFETLSVTTGFVNGTNTIAFVVANSGGPTGLRVELDLTK